MHPKKYHIPKKMHFDIAVFWNSNKYLYLTMTVSYEWYQFLINYRVINSYFNSLSWNISFKDRFSSSISRNVSLTDEMQNESPKNLYNAIMHQKILE